MGDDNSIETGEADARSTPARTMAPEPIAAALRNHAAKLRQVNVETSAEHNLVRDAAELLRVLARLMEGTLPIKAFGPPGDWGYETEIGRAIVALRQGTCAGSVGGPRHG